MKPVPAPAAALRIATDAMRAPFASWLRPEANLVSEPDKSRRQSCSLDAICTRLRNAGHRVLGPIASPAIRIDRVVIGPAGVYALRVWGPSEGLAAGTHLRVGATAVQVDTASAQGDLAPWGQDLVAQARICASYLRTLLEDTPGWRPRQAVVSVMLFEGCAVEQTPESRSWLWALESGAFDATLEARIAAMRTGGESPCDATSISALADRLEQHIGARAALR